MRPAGDALLAVPLSGPASLVQLIGAFAPQYTIEMKEI